jgi:hypothetical protein
MTNGISAFGTKLSWNGVNLAELTNISGPKIKIKTEEMTNHDSTGGFAEFIATIKDGGEISIEGNFVAGDTTGQIAMITDIKAGTKRQIILTAPSSLFTWTSDVIGTDFEPTFPHAGMIGFKATLKATGEPVLAITASGNLTTLTGIEENTGAALTFTPTFDGATKEYNVAINTASTWIKLTPTKSGATVTIYNGTSSQDVASGAQSGTIAVTDAAVTTITLSVKETGKVANVYTLHVYTP